MGKVYGRGPWDKDLELTLETLETYTGEFPREVIISLIEEVSELKDGFIAKINTWVNVPNKTLTQTKELLVLFYFEKDLITQVTGHEIITNNDKTTMKGGVKKTLEIHINSHKKEINKEIEALVEKRNVWDERLSDLKSRNFLSEDYRV